MHNIELSMDIMPYKSKPSGSEIGEISNRIAKRKTTINTPNEIKEIVKLISRQGYTFCPATFRNGKRNQDNFKQMQLIALDFDSGISLNEVLDRSKEYNLPVLFAYETLTSVNQNKFRVVFQNDTPIIDKRLANITLNALMTIFPEADKTCEDIAKMFFGGKNLLYFDGSLPAINTETLLMNMTIHLNKERGDSHYKQHVYNFAKKHGIRLNNKGLLDISIKKCPTEYSGTSIPIGKNGKNSPNAILLRIANGEKLPNLSTKDNSCCCIHLDDGCTRFSVGEKRDKNHSEYRSSVLKDISGGCRLFREFEFGGRKLEHDELFGISTNIIHIETGIKVFRDILSRNPNFYTKTKQDNWNYYLKYIKDMNYAMKKCSNYCPYKDMCRHGNNILSTVKPKRKIMERLNNYPEIFYPIDEVQEDVKSKLMRAVEAKDTKWHIIKAQTAIGKTETYLELMKTAGLKFLIAVPTNILKNDIYNRAVEKKLNVMMTPSLDEIKKEMPKDVWGYIDKLRKTGRHSKVYPYICKTAQEEKIECLEDFLKQQKEFEEFDGHAITTHRKLLNMNMENLKKYNVVLIDEDIILSSIIPNQCEIPVSILKKVRKYACRDTAYGWLADKINEVLKAIKKETLFRVSGFKWDNKNCKDEDADNIFSLADIPSFCLAEYFMYKDTSKEDNLSEGSIIFLKPYQFKNIKYIMVSATADKDICEYLFGKTKVIFYECNNARYEGVLNQYYEKSMSRACIDKNMEILDKIQQWYKFSDMITFKKYSRGKIYFGNAIGYDNLKGKNINVVGTPYHVDFLYKLLPFTLGLDVKGDAKMKPCLVTHNDYRFNFTTYGEEHEILRKFHFWMIESDLEQAVGRARLLRYGCTVNLFSNFPVKQAVMHLEYKGEVA